ncbi:MAG TPA: hypothetical protein VM492_18465, partial [Sumerlaeia bacterium]|nr:hypothetical protein [Sumerlaeia bacterium]
DELTGVVQALDRENIPYALAGGLAYSVLVETRATEDIDLLVHAKDWPRIPNVLAALGFKELSGPMEFRNVRIRRLTKVLGDNVLVLDFVLAGEDFAEGIEKSLRLRHGGREYRIVPPDVLIALKKGRMSAKDRSDIEGLQRLLDESEP